VAAGEQKKGKAMSKDQQQLPNNVLIPHGPDVDGSVS